MEFSIGITMGCFIMLIRGGWVKKQLGYPLWATALVVSLGSLLTRYFL